MKLGTRLTLFLSLIIAFVLSGYGYFHIASRREVMTQSMRLEVRNLAESLKFGLEKISLPKELIYIQELLDSISEPEETLGVIFYHKRRDQVFLSRTLTGNIHVFLESILRAMEEDRAQENFTNYQGAPVYSFSFSLKDSPGRVIGGAAIIQKLSAIQKHIKEATEAIVLYVVALIAATAALVLWVTRKWLTQPISTMMNGIKRLAQGDFQARIDLHGRDELSELALSINQMAADLNKAQERIVQEAEIRLNLERHLRQAEKLATIGQLASELAHEIGTPLNIIGGRAEMIKRKLGEAEGVQKNLETILKQTEKITKIIQQLLGFVRKKKPEQVPVSMGHLLDSTLDFLSPQTEKLGIEVRKGWTESGPWVKGDPDQLQQVLLNVVVNSLQAMPQGGTLILEANSRKIFQEGMEGPAQAFAEIIIADTGPGMNPEVEKNIFQPFFTTKEGDEGTGLGLTITQGIIQDHEGWIEVHSDLGKGSQFKIYLPAIPSPEQDGEMDLGY